MHGKLIVLIPKEYEMADTVMDDFYKEILYGLGVDYIGERIRGNEAESIYELFKALSSSIDTETMTVKDSMDYRFDYPVVIFDDMYPTVFRSFVEYKAYCDLYGLSVEEYDWQVWDFHFGFGF